MIKLSHIHEVNDSDNKFIVDGISRAIKNTSASKTTVMQFDHNSEVFTFESCKCCTTILDFWIE